MQTKYTYDPLGRILTVTTGYESINAATTSYEYDYEYEPETDNYLFVIIETAPNGTVTKTYLDGFGNETVVKFGENQKVATKASYNTLKQLLEERTYDYNVNSLADEKNYYGAGE
ncbi:hypothetical protein BC1_00018 [Bacillus phage BC-1]|nr:hypothetical protein BC1_00018 [Bacillus phage BC-1]